MTHQASIYQFFNHFRTQLDAITHVESRLYRKVLLCTYLDALARAASPRSKSNRERFTNLLRDYSRWEDGARVSLPQLRWRLFKSESRFPELLEWVNARLSKWEYGQTISLSKDASWSDVVHYIDAESSKLAHDAVHYQLFYQHRSTLVHELREPGYQFEISNDNSFPYYLGMLDGLDGDSSSSWELTYPLDFMVAISRAVTTHLQNEFMQKDMDPYASFEFGSLWKSRPNSSSR